jgi:hypothetical protein
VVGFQLPKDSFICPYDFKIMVNSKQIFCLVSHFLCLANCPEPALTLIRTFNTGWKRSLDDIESEVRTTFPNFKNGHNILQGILAHFVRYYHRLQKVLSVPAFKQVQSRGELLNVHHIVMEVKKFKPNF